MAGIWHIIELRHPVVTFFAFLLGACIGSFVNACAYRIPRDIGLSDDRSFCPLCGTPIRWWHNIPIVSWLWLRGRCAYCGGKISPLYLVIEAMCAALFSILFVRYGMPVAGAYWVLTALLLLGMRTDIEWQIIPDRVTLGGFGLGVLFSALLPGLHGETGWQEGMESALFGAAVCGSCLYAIGWAGTRLLKKEAMGLGDVKLLLCFGSFLGWQGGIFSAMAGSIIGAAIGMVFLWATGRKWGSFMAIPFGPPLMMGAWLWLLGGRELWNAHFGGIPELAGFLAP